MIFRWPEEISIAISPMPGMHTMGRAIGASASARLHHAGDPQCFQSTEADAPPQIAMYGRAIGASAPAWRHHARESAVLSID